MAFDHRVYRNKDGIGMPSDEPAVNSTDDNTMVGLLKGLYALLSGPLDTNPPVGGSTEAKQDAGNATLTAIDGHFDGIETLITSSNTKLDTLHTDLTTTIAVYIDGLEALIGTTNTGSASILAKLSADPATQTTLAAVLAKLNSSVAVTGTFWQATQPISMAGALPTGSNAIGKLAANSGVTIGAVELAAAQTLAAVTAITNALPAGTNLLGRAVADASAATGGIASTKRLLSAAASTNGDFVKASAGRLYAIQGYNAASAVRYLKLYNKASAPTVGTDTPVKTLAIPPGVGFTFDWPHGYSFSTGIAFALTTGSADADTGALTAADVLGLNLDYV